MRCFLAIELPEIVAGDLSALQKRMGMLDRAVRWTRPEQIHLTVKFLGEVPDAQVPAVAEAAIAAARRYAPFELHVGGTGCFPPRGPARIVWAGIRNPPATLFDCQQACEQALAQLGFKPEGRSFHPHLTIGRVRDNRSSRDIRAAVEREQRFATEGFLVRELVLFQSILERSGPTYVPVSRASLNGAG